MMSQHPVSTMLLILVLTQDSMIQEEDS
ncbi:uncharacterized protein METZ01_LOCUS464715 [marine metagenome]|uniref:Uncharacterized protein n=1 Tax=marine metagenome TaxID=408172 RepID=A0A383AW82_9ZZZZ